SGRQSDAAARTGNEGDLAAQLEVHDAASLSASRHNGAAVWRHIMHAVAELPTTTPSGLGELARRLALRLRLRGDRRPRRLTGKSWLLLFPPQARLFLKTDLIENRGKRRSRGLAIVKLACRLSAGRPFA